MNGARDLSCGRVRAALRLERADLAVALAGEVRSSCLPSSARRVAWRKRGGIFSALCRRRRHSGCDPDRRRSRFRVCHRPNHRWVTPPARRKVQVSIPAICSPSGITQAREDVKTRRPKSAQFPLTLPAILCGCPRPLRDLRTCLRRQFSRVP